MLDGVGARPPEFFVSEIQRQVPPFGFSLEHSRVCLLARYLAELDLWRRRTNLTGPIVSEELVSHALESAFGGKLISDSARLLDIGSGAGLPGIPLAITRPDLTVTLNEPRVRRAAFLRHVVRAVPVENARVLEERAENLTEPAYDVATSRALANLKQILNRAEFLESGGVLVSWTTQPNSLADVLSPDFSLERIEHVPGTRGKFIAALRKRPIRSAP